jgi:hypothetical protein
MDDYFSYKGDPDKGVAGAFAEFLKKNQNIEVRQLLTYGYGGVAYIVSRV